MYKELIRKKRTDTKHYFYKTLFLQIIIFTKHYLQNIILQNIIFQNIIYKTFFTKHFTKRFYTNIYSRGERIGSCYR